MVYRTEVLRAGDLDDHFSAAWDRLPASRGDQADIYDSHAWLASWLASVGQDTAARLRIAAVLDGDRPVALLPLVALGRGRCAVAGRELRTRARPIVAGPAAGSAAGSAAEPDASEALGLLAEVVAAAGGRDLLLHRLPSRDPVTPAFIDALRATGHRVACRERSADRIASAAEGWAGHARRFRSFAQYARRQRGRIAPLWDVGLDEYGTSPAMPVEAGFAVYEELQRRSWKGPFPPAVRRQRAELLRRAETRGWARVFVLRIGEVPAAAHVWFRLGSVATWLSTAYDHTLAALSPGTVVMWAAQERLFAADAPRVVDLLPGANAQKDRLAPEQPPLLVVEAARRMAVAGVTLPLRSQARRVRAGASTRLRARLAVRPPRPDAAADQASGQGLRPVRIAPGAGGGVRVRELVLDPGLRRYLAAAGGHPSAEAMAETWRPGDAWWAVGTGPQGLLRISGGTRDGTGERMVREVVRVAPAVDAEGLTAALAAGLGTPLTLLFLGQGGSEGRAGDATAVRDSLLPWPRAWAQEPAQDAARDLIEGEAADAR